MKFACDSCGAQYVIADEKIGPRGVKVRCKKCSNVVVVRPGGPDTDAPEPGGTDEAAVDAPEAFAGEEVEAEIGAAFDSIFGGEAEAPGAAEAPEPAEAPEAWEPPPEPAPQPEPEPPPVLEAEAPSDDDDEDPFADVDDAFAAALSPEGASEPEARETPDPFAASAFEAEAPAAPPEPDPAEIEWFVAIEERQVGPLDLAAVRARWEAGEITPDSLVWREGLTEWRPLSSVETLKRELAPGPVALEPPPPAAEEREPAPHEEAPDEVPEWKPAGASLLASLADEEMKALDRPPEREPASPEPGARAGRDAGLGGLDLDLPPPPPAAPETAGPEAAAWQPGPGVGGGAHGATTARRDAAGWGTPGRLVGLVSASAVLVAALVVGSLWAAGVFDRSGGGARAAAEPPETGIVAVAADGGSPDGGEADGGALAGADAGADAADGGAEALAEAADAGTAEPEAEPEPEPTKVAAAEPAPRPKPAPRRRPRRTTRRTEPARAAAPAPTPAPAPAPSRSSGSGGSLIDDEALFGDDTSLEEELFGSSSGGSSAPKPKPESDSGARPGGYIPPAPGSKDLPKALGQGDILMVVSGKKPEFKQCVERQQKADPSLSGPLVLSWQIRPDGRTSNVRCKNLPDSEFCACAKDVMSKTKFPPYGGPQMEPIEIPLSF